MNADNTSSRRAIVLSAQSPGHTQSEASNRGARTDHSASSLPRDSALRRHRLKLTRQLKLVACLREQLDEAQAEIVGLENIVAAQAATIAALKDELERQKR